MAKNLEIKIVNGKFESVNGTVKSFSATKIIGMGWFVKIYDDGSINAVCTEINKFGNVEVKVKLTKDSFYITRVYKEIKKEKKTEIKQLDGLLTLSGDEDKRRVYFEEEDKIKLKKDYFLNEIEKCDPNRTYDVHISAIAHTDGKFFKTIIDKSNCIIKITDATWAIIEIPVGKTTRYLYSLKSYNELDLPIILSSNGRAELTSYFRNEFENVGAALEYLQKLNLYKEEMYNLEEFESDEVKVKAEYYLNCAGILTIYLSKISIWNSKESLEKSGVNKSFVLESKGCYYKIDRVLEAKGSQDYTNFE